MRHHLPKRKPLDPCPIETVLALVQAKWTSRILHLLFQTPQHFGAIRRGLPGISSEVLAARLGALTRDGLIENQPCTDPRRRSYQPTARGRSLQPVLQAVAEWGLVELDRLGQHWQPTAPEGHDVVARSRSGNSEYWRRGDSTGSWAHVQSDRAPNEAP